MVWVIFAISYLHSYITTCIAIAIWLCCSPMQSLMDINFPPGWFIGTSLQSANFVGSLAKCITIAVPLAEQLSIPRSFPRFGMLEAPSTHISMTHLLATPSAILRHDCRLEFAGLQRHRHFGLTSRADIGSRDKMLSCALQTVRVPRLRRPNVSRSLTWMGTVMRYIMLILKKTYILKNEVHPKESPLDTPFLSKCSPPLSHTPFRVYFFLPHV